MRKWLYSAVLLVGALATAAAAPKPAVKVSKPFAGAKVNGGTVSMTMDMGHITLTLSDEVQDPKTPDPHWQVVDGKGRSYLLDKLTIKGDKFNRTITLPDYIKDVQKVVIYCAWAEANLGEAAF